MPPKIDPGMDSIHARQRDAMLSDDYTPVSILDGPMAHKALWVQRACKTVQFPFYQPVALINIGAPDGPPTPHHLVYKHVSALDGRGRDKQTRFFALDEVSRVVWWICEMGGDP